MRKLLVSLFHQSSAASQRPCRIAHHVLCAIHCQAVPAPLAAVKVFQHAWPLRSFCHTSLLSAQRPGLHAAALASENQTMLDSLRPGTLHDSPAKVSAGQGDLNPVLTSPDQSCPDLTSLDQS